MTYTQMEEMGSYAEGHPISLFLRISTTNTDVWKQRSWIRKEKFTRFATDYLGYPTSQIKCVDASM